MALAWKEIYETGNDRIDSQHKKIFEMTNRLEAMLAGTEAFDPGSVMRYLDMYVSIHFCYEESCMFTAKCRVHKVNRDAHVRFMELFDKMQARFKKDGPTREFVQELYDAIAEWIVQHICKIDINLRETNQAAA